MSACLSGPLFVPVRLHVCTCVCLGTCDLGDWIGCMCDVGGGVSL